MHMKVKQNKDGPIVYRKKVENRLNEELQKCEQCGYSTFVKGNFLVHLRTHRSEKLFKCDQCPYEGNQKVILESHKRSVHENLFL